MVTTHRFVKRAVLLSLLSLLSGAEARAAADYIYPTINSKQEHDNWCWAASSQAVLKAYGKTAPQCDIANWRNNRGDCCGSTEFSWNHGCNVPAWPFGDPGGNRTVADILAAWGLQVAPGRRGPLTTSEIVSQIHGGRPIVMGWGTTPCPTKQDPNAPNTRWDPSGFCGGHFLVVDGYEDDGNMVWYMDPWDGDDNLVRYTWVVGGTGNDHVWNNSVWLTTPNPGKTVTTAKSALIMSIVNELLQ